MDASQIQFLVKNALEEDIGSGDITAEIISPDSTIQAIIISREKAIFCGRAFAETVFSSVDKAIILEWNVKDGDTLSVDQTLVKIKGPARSILTAERTALNFLQTLSGTATLTSQYISQLTGTSAQLLDTRKTIPGLRVAQKYAVTCGGGKNHRMGLFDAFLIKENHIATCGSITTAIENAKKIKPDLSVEIEVENLIELEEAINAKVDIALLDNFTLNDLEHAVELNQHRIKLEASGGLTLDNIRSIAQTGVDFISVGAITKHVQAVDLSMLANINK